MPECSEVIYSNDYDDYIVSYYGNVDYVIDTFAPECYQLIDSRLAVIYLKRDSIDSRGNHNTAGGFYVPQYYGLLDSTAISSIGVDQVRRQPSLELYGHNVIVGLIDTGIDYRHKAFRNADGTTRILSIWDQTLQENPPDGFLYGTEYTQTNINEALASQDPLSVVPQQDEIGHGTFLAGIAAGNIIDEENFSGAAPLADIIMVKLKPAKQNLKDFYFVGTDEPCYQENDIMLGIKYLIMEAERARKPLVVMLGLGTNLGDHNGGGPLGEYLNDNGLRRSVAFVCAGGNEVNRGHHFTSNLMQPRQQEEIELKVASGETGFTMQLWADTVNIFSVGIVSPSGEYSGKIPARAEQTQIIPFILERTTIYVSYQLVTAQQGAEMVMLRFQTPEEGVWRIRVFNESGFPGIFNTWLPTEGFIQNDTIFLRANPNNTICEPANGRLVSTNATYNHITDSLYIYSSRGFTSGGYAKPDITAPGVDIRGPYPGLEPDDFTYMTGSSVGAAFVAGVAALLLEWGFGRGNDYNMTSRVVLNYIIRGAQKENIVYPSAEWGWGILDAYGIFESLRLKG